MTFDSQQEDTPVWMSGYFRRPLWTLPDQKEFLIILPCGLSTDPSLGRSYCWSRVKVLNPELYEMYPVYSCDLDLVTVGKSEALDLPVG